MLSRSRRFISEVTVLPKAVADRSISCRTSSGISSRKRGLRLGNFLFDWLVATGQLSVFKK